MTGARGFLGWHLRCRLAATRGIEAVPVGRHDFDDPRALARKIKDVDVVYHLAGINRAPLDADVEQGNIEAARTLIDVLPDGVHLVYANSVHARGDTPYGRGKAAAADVLSTRAPTMTNVFLPNLFGEHGRPNYNSYVATFCNQVVSGERPQVSNDRVLPVLHAQDAAEALVAGGENRVNGDVEPPGEAIAITAVLALIQQFHDQYSLRGEIPDLSRRLSRSLFNTYRSYLFPRAFPMFPERHSDQRGMLVEMARSHGGTSQAFASSTEPGQTRGDHYHLHKFERFMVLDGDAEIALRRLYGDQVERFRVSGREPCFVDMPTMWTHHIRNVGSRPLLTAFWTDHLLASGDPDQYPLRVEELT
ncbi:type 8 capsular polysaccharide synthesis protein Cap8F [Nocardioides hungaricus]